MRGEGKFRSCSGYLTVYLALILAVLLALCLALIEGVRQNTARMEAECVTQMGISSVLAEYHRELFNRYHLFAIDSSYGTTLSGHENTERHLLGYLERNLSMDDIFLSDYLYRDFLSLSVSSVEMTDVSILTDGGGAVFRDRAVEAVKDDCNLTLMEELQQWVRTVEGQGLAETDIAAQKREADSQIQSYNGSQVQISESEWTTVEIQNPTEELEQIRSRGVLGHIVDEEELSHKNLRSEQLIQARMGRGEVSRGNAAAEQGSDEDSMLQQFLFQEYLMRYMGRYGSVREGSALDYQIEYLLSGKDGDAENLKSVVNRICAIREAANALYLFSDSEKCEEAELAATAVAALIQVPELAEPLKVVLLLGWAYAESVHDLEVLLNGGKVPLLKDGENWYYSIENALQAAGGEAGENTEGLSYGDYLRVLMTFVDTDVLTGRAMNMVEADIRLTPGNAAFRLDACYDRVGFRVCVRSAYGYEYEITRQRGYDG